MTDLEKMKKCLTELHIPFTVNEDRLGDGCPAIEIGYDDEGNEVCNYDDLFDGVYNASLVIYFHSGGRFKSFLPIGE